MKNKKINKSTYAFIDASNIIYGARAEGWFIDQQKLYHYLKEKYNISKAYFYYGKDSKNEKQEKFLKKLESFGYILRVKEIKRFGKRSKANCDVDLTMDMLLLSLEYRRAIVLTGDGDFAPLFLYLISKRKEIVIISSPKITSRDLKIIVGNKHVDFGSLRYFLEFKSNKKRGRP